MQNRNGIYWSLEPDGYVPMICLHGQSTVIESKSSQGAPHILTRGHPNDITR